MRSVIRKAIVAAALYAGAMMADRSAEAGMMRCLDYNQRCIDAGCQPEYNGACQQGICQVRCTCGSPSWQYCS